MRCSQLIRLDPQHAARAGSSQPQPWRRGLAAARRRQYAVQASANAAAVIFAHNHPSGVAQPSQSDELLTRNLKEALSLIEVKVLDHFIVAGHQAISFAERGLL